MRVQEFWPVAKTLAQAELISAAQVERKGTHLRHAANGNGPFCCPGEGNRGGKGHAGRRVKRIRFKDGASSGAPSLMGRANARTRVLACGQNLGAGGIDFAAQVEREGARLRHAANGNGPSCCPGEGNRGGKDHAGRGVKRALSHGDKTDGMCPHRHIPPFYFIRKL